MSLSARSIDDGDDNSNGIASRIILPIIIIVVALIGTGLSALYCRRVLYRNRQLNTEWDARNAGQTETPPTWLEVHLDWQVDGEVPLNKLRVCSLVDSPLI